LSTIYYLASQISYLFLHLIALWNKKVALGLKGRKEQKAILKETSFSGDWVWMHCSSLGEFEQGRPVLEAIKKRYPEVQIALTFFSPSGYEIRKNYELADWISYLPFDSPGNARFWLEKFKPRLAIFVKYDLWHFYLKKLKAKGTPTILISAKFNPKHRYFRWYGRFFKKMLLSFSAIFVQDDISKKLLDKTGYKNAIRAGDNRIDRVSQIPNRAEKYPPIEAFCGKQPILVAGSSWPADEELLFQLLQHESFEDWKILLAPHDISLAHIQQIEERLPVSYQKYSRIKDGQPLSHRVLIIDNIGMLSSLYQYGKLAYIGGGFGTGLHNTLEPIAFGLPVLFGPEYHKFEESVYLVKKEAGFSISNAEELIAAFKKLLDKEQYDKASAVARLFIDQNRGATEIVMKWIAVKVPLLRPRID
jgi:3-deoxy-D-manno-octulosonic-acid transferase